MWCLAEESRFPRHAFESDTWSPVPSCPFPDCICMAPPPRCSAQVHGTRQLWTVSSETVPKSNLASLQLFLQGICHRDEKGISYSKRGEEEAGAECPGLSELHRGLGTWTAGRVKDRCVQVGLPTKLPGQTVLDLKEKGQAGRASDGSAPALPHVSSYSAQSPGFRKQRLLCSKAKL